MTLQTMEPDPTFDSSAHAAAVETFAALDDELVVRVWCDDGCSDCRAVLPGFAAALDAAGFPDERVVQYPVERLPSGAKAGPEVDAYGVERIPTIVVEHEDGAELARFVESAPVPAVEHLADRLRSSVE